MVNVFWLIMGIVFLAFLIIIIFRIHINTIKNKEMLEKIEDEQQEIINKLNRVLEKEEKIDFSRKI